MLKFLPVSEGTSLERLFAGYGVGLTDGAAGYEAFDGDERIGACLFRIEGTTAEILLLDPAGDVMLCDAMTRSVVNYAGGRGAFEVICRGEREKEVLRRLGLMGEGDEIDIPSMMSGCKGCK